MNKPFLPFSRPSINAEAINEVVACLQSGWITTGPRVQQFSENLAAYLNAPFVLPLSSATAGLHLALLGMGIKPGDEVITTPLTFVATLNMIVVTGAKPVLVDIDPLTFNMDLNQLEDAITKKTRVIIPVHFAGLPIDLDLLYQLAKHHQLRVIEDAAHAIGAEYKHRLIGSFGDTQVFSFHPNKNMTTGEGGAVTTRDEALAKNIKLMRFHGIDREAWNRHAKFGSHDYDVTMPGFKYNMMDIQAVLGLHQLNALDNFITRRYELVSRYEKTLSNWPQLKLPKPPNFSHRHAWHLYTPLISDSNGGLDRDMFIRKMKEQNIGIGLHYNPAHLYTFYREKFGFKPGDFPHAEYVGKHIVSLPLFPSMTNVEQDRVVETMACILDDT